MIVAKRPALQAIPLVGNVIKVVMKWSLTNMEDGAAKLEGALIVAILVSHLQPTLRALRAEDLFQDNQKPRVKSIMTAWDAIYIDTIAAYF